MNEYQQWPFFWTSREVEGLLLASSIAESVLFERHHLVDVVGVESIDLFVLGHEEAQGKKVGQS